MSDEGALHFELDGTAGACLDNLIANADAWGLPNDPGAIASMSIVLFHAVHRCDLVFVERAAAEAAGLRDGNMVHADGVDQVH